MKIKLRPRGRPFAKGNKIGHRFKKNEPSPNPGGRPKSAKLSEAYRALLALPAGAPVEIRTNAEALAYKIFKMGRKGSLGAAVEVGDRSEGRPAVSISMEGGDNLALILAHMDETVEELPAPEGMVPRSKITGQIIDR
jgi:hypothetical protein